MVDKRLLSLVMSELGKKGGRIGGKRCLETMTPAARLARAKKASLAAAKKRTAARLAREADASAEENQPVLEAADQGVADVEASLVQVEQPSPGARYELQPIPGSFGRPRFRRVLIKP